MLRVHSRAMAPSKLSRRFSSLYVVDDDAKRIWRWSSREEERREENGEDDDDAERDAKKVMDEQEIKKEKERRKGCELQWLIIHQSMDRTRGAKLLVVVWNTRLTE